MNARILSGSLTPGGGFNADGDIDRVGHDAGDRLPDIFRGQAAREIQAFAELMRFTGQFPAVRVGPLTPILGSRSMDIQQERLHGSVEVGDLAEVFVAADVKRFDFAAHVPVLADNVRPKAVLIVLNLVKARENVPAFQTPAYVGCTVKNADPDNALRQSGVNVAEVQRGQ